MSHNMNVLLVGAGYMGREYCKVLKAQNVPHSVVCRTENTALRFQKELGIMPLYGGVEKVLSEQRPLPTCAIVAVNVEYLMETTLVLMKAGVKKILLEKPGGLNAEQIRAVYETAETTGSTVYLAYNRRFYASTEKALQIIKEDGGVTSYHFEFTEWSFKIEPMQRPKEVKDAWLLANSSHVIDLAFFLGGYPSKISAYKAGELSWHKTASRYVGAGITDTGVLFSYQANWDAPGRWAVEVLTKEHRLYFRPLEKLSVQRKGSVNVESVDIDDELDVQFKPGLYNQVKAFLSGDKQERLATIEDQWNHMTFYQTIETGNT